MGFWSDAAGEIWGAVSNPIQTVSQAAVNVWNDIKFNVGFLSGDQTATQQVQNDINAQQQAANDYIASHPGATEQDYNDYMTSTFPDNFSAYVNQPPTGSANNVVSNSDQYIKLALGVGVVAIIISIFRD